MTKLDSRKYLAPLVDALRGGGKYELRYAEEISGVLASTDAEVEAFLVSNELWGGMGSIADQAGGEATDVEARRRILDAFIQLGEHQLENDHVNVRTKSWVAAFRVWRSSNVI